jgi:hypothetical protein
MVYSLCPIGAKEKICYGSSLRTNTYLKNRNDHSFAPMGQKNQRLVLFTDIVSRWDKYKKRNNLDPML